MSFTEAEKLECVERELRMRRKVYPAWVRTARMREAQAEREIALMEAIVADYRERAGMPDLLERSGV